MHLLKIKILADCPNIEFVKTYYEQMANNCLFGVSLILPDDEMFITNKIIKCGMGIVCELFLDEETVPNSYDLVPTFDITNTPLMLANSVQFVPAGSSEELIVSFRCFIDRDFKTTVNDFKYLAPKGSRLVQIVSPDRKPMKVEIVQ